MRENVNYNRYQRQMVLSDIGIVGQKKLLSAKVLLIGAGGLGCPILQYLAAAGVGTIGVVDGGKVEESNLHRQVIYKYADIGKYKSQKSQIIISEINPDSKIISHREFLTPINACDIISSYDIVIDGSDNYPTRYLINDSCVILNKPLVYGSVLKYEGQIGVFNVADAITGIKTNYRDLFPIPPDPATVKSCSEAGVLGVVPGIIGTMQAAEAIKLITGVGQPLINKVMVYNIKTNFNYEFKITENTTKPDNPKTVSQLYEYNYEWFCSGGLKEFEITPEEFETLFLLEDTIIVDIREKNEQPKLSGFYHLTIPMSEWEIRMSETKQYKKIILVCQSGKRSLKMAQQLNKMDTSKTIQSLNGGMENWLRYKK